MYNSAEKTCNTMMRNLLFLLHWSIHNPKLVLLLLLFYLVLPILARETRKQYWQLECGTFKISNYKWQGNSPSGLFFADNLLCFLPFKYRGNDNIVACYLGDVKLFDTISLADDEIKVALMKNNLTFCDQFNMLRK